MKVWHQRASASDCGGLATAAGGCRSAGRGGGVRACVCVCVEGGSFRYEFMSLAPGWNAELAILLLTLRYFYTGI